MRNIHYAAILLVLLAVLAALLLWTPLGHRAERAGTRLAGMIRHATDPVFPRPLVLLRIWRARDEGGFRAEVYKSGSLIVYSQGRTERRISRDQVDRLVEVARAAYADFGAHDCNTAPDGINADLYLLREGRWMGNSCRQSSEWPTGEFTRQLLDELRSLVPERIVIPTGPGYMRRPTGPSP